MIHLRSFIASLFLVFSATLVGQVNSVNYQMKFDTATCLYDCYIIINSGSASTVAQRIQFNAQYSIVTPYGATLTMANRYMPLQNNADYSGTDPTEWAVSTVHHYPLGTPTLSFHSITPPLNPISHYNNISSGDTIKLFSLSITPTTNCASDIWIYRNGVDPNSSDPDMQGLDFENGFTIGSATQLYNDNSTQLYPPSPIIASTTTYCSNGIEIDLEAYTSACQMPLTYSWTGPNSYTSSNQDVSINPSTAADNGLYEVIIEDAYGCQDSVSIVATSKPDAGPNVTVCAGSIDTLYGTSPSTGTWSARPGNPAGATITNLGAGVGRVVFTNGATGTYGFIYAIPGCSDTMDYTVNAKPVVSITGSNQVCIGETTTLSPSTGGTWISNNPAVATVTNAGVVTPVASGTVTFTFTQTSTGCSNTTPAVTVNPKPTVTNTGNSSICIGGTTNLTPTSGGTWTSVNPTIASVTNAGLVTGLSAGVANLLFTETSTSCVSDTVKVTVTPRPTVSITGSDSICVQTTTTLSPSTGGTWSSSNNLIATVNNSGVVTGLQAGKVVFTFTNSATLCVSDPTDTVTVLNKPTVSITGSNRICINATTTLSPSTGGTWVSNNPSVATVTNAGVVTSVSQGSATFTFTNTATGCSSTTPAVIVDPKPSVSSGQAAICIGSNTLLSPSSGGTWTAHTPSIASLSNGNRANGISAGTAKFTFLESGTGCVSDTIFITVEPGPVVSITGDDEICVGFTTQLSPSTGGTWASSNPSIATVNNSGLVTGVAAGVVTFTFTSITTFCTSAPTDPITVIARPTVTLSDNNLCIGETANVTPSTGGTWTSSNPGVATVTNAGVVTAVSAGSATFTFTNTTTGCVSSPTSPVTVNGKPTVSFTGPSTVCVGFTTTVSPTTGGVWVSGNTAIATVTNTGVVTAVAAGTTTLTFIETSTGCASNNLNVTINPKPTISLTGADEICVNATTTLSPTSGGSWTSSNNSIATITNAGVVTGHAQGTVTFTFISSAGCPSDASDPVTVNDPPTVTISGNDEICIGDTTNLSPSSGGIWTSSNAGIATVSSGGIVVGISAGSVTFNYQDTVTGCASQSTAPLTVNPKPTINLSGPNNICVGNTTSISPFTGGSWISTNPAVAAVNNNGIITGLAPGTARFIYTNSATGCVSDTSAVVTVTPGPIISITGDDELCIGETSTLSPASGGVWTSSNTNVATITNAGIVTAVASGNATFTFTQSGTGCQSEASDPIIVHGKPTVSVNGPEDICVGGTTNLLPSNGGTWTSSNPSVATVDNSGLVTGVSPGNAQFTFTLTATGCTSDPADATVTVNPTPVATITGASSICIGGETTVTPSTGGLWTSSNSNIATITNSGVIKGRAPGKVTFTYTELGSGCGAQVTTDTITISNCMDPDFNATFVNVAVNGDVSTNDIVPGGTTYGNSPVLVSKPAGSIASISMDDAGLYTFTGNTVGVYVYNVQVCVPPFLVGCPTTLLTITVTDHLKPDLYPIANKDIATTLVNTPVTLKSLANDHCVVVTGCSLDSTSVSILSGPANGGAIASGVNGDITYTPANNFIGKDTLVYTVCVDGEPGNCATARQIITVYDPSADNDTEAADDFAVTAELTPVSGNVKDNDVDHEGDTQTVTAQNVSVAAGDLSLASDGSYTFTPAEEFFGSVDFVYETCDDNVDTACTNATLHILVVPDLSVRVRVYLEGSLMNNANKIGTTHTRPLMRDNLRSSPFNGSTYIPTTDPYENDLIMEGGNPYVLNIGSKYTHSGPGDNTEFLTIPNPSTVFAVTGEDAIVDWVFIELRSKLDTNVLATRSGLLHRDGDVVDLNGTRGLRFPGVQMDDYFVSVRHRNHLGAMTKNAQTPQQLTTLVDFTSPSKPVFDFGVRDFGGGVIYDYTGLAQKPGVKSGYMALWAGDFDANGKVKADNPNDDLNSVFSDVFFHPDNVTLNVNFDFAYGYRSADYDMNAKVKYDNPNDDKNMLYGQLLFYPLNQFFLSNFDFFVEQLP